MKTTLNETNAVKDKHIQIQDVLLKDQLLLIQELKQTALILQAENKILRSDLTDSNKKYDSLKVRELETIKFSDEKDKIIENLVNALKKTKL